VKGGVTNGVRYRVTFFTYMIIKEHYPYKQIEWEISIYVVRDEEEKAGIIF